MHSLVVRDFSLFRWAEATQKTACMVMVRDGGWGVLRWGREAKGRLAGFGTKSGS